MILDFWLTSHHKPKITGGEAASRELSAGPIGVAE